jgi:hypothetical protein
MQANFSFFGNDVKISATVLTAASVGDFVTVDLTSSDGGRVAAYLSIEQALALSDALRVAVVNHQLASEVAA